MKKAAGKIVAINGEFFCRNLTGVERLAIEVTGEFDKIAPAGLFELVVPQNAKNVPQYKNIRLVRLKSDAKFFPKWTQVDFQKYVILHGRVPLDYSNTCPYFVPGIEFIHDIYCELYPGDLRSRRDKFVRFYSCAMYRRIARRAKKVVTVSECAKKTIVDAYKINPDRVAVVYSGVSAYKEIEPDFTVFDRLPQLKDKEFYFTLGSLSTRKNLKWIAANAKAFPDAFFAISGKPLPSVVAPELQALKEVPNVIMTGYLSDAEVKAVLSKAKAFVFPSYFEGFGLPPLEALSCGTPIVISNKTSLPEIYGKCAHYIDPDNPDVDLNELLKEKVEPPDAILKKFTLENTAARLLGVIKESLDL